MTIEQILECSAEELEKMSDAELEKHFEPYFKVTRPELAEKPVSKGTVRKVSSQSGFGSKLSQVRRMAEELGLELDL